MTVKIGINGFGRIGRLVFRTIKQRHPGSVIFFFLKADRTRNHKIPLYGLCKVH